jgi:cystathionine beta-lyase
VDLSIQAATKYIAGHSDLMMGVVSANATSWPALHNAVITLGLCVAPDDIYLAQRGLRTLAVRLARHQQSATSIARWLTDRPEVSRVLHPGLEADRGHAIWKRDFLGSSGLFAVVLRPASDQAVHTFLESLSLFGLGYSWGGYESLVILFDWRNVRTTGQWAPEGPTLRFHIGLEDVQDLIADLEQGFEKMARVV